VAVTAAHTPDRGVIDKLLQRPNAGKLAAETDAAGAAPVADTAVTATSLPLALMFLVMIPATTGGTESNGFEVNGDLAFAGGCYPR